MAELKPCKCGRVREVELYYLPSAEFTACAVICNICGAQTPLYVDKEAAIDAWNKRSK